MRVIGYLISNGNIGTRTRVIVVERPDDINEAINRLVCCDNVPNDQIVVNPVLEPVDPKELRA